MSLVDALGGAAVGSVLGAVLSYQATRRHYRRELQTEVVRELEEVVAEMKLFAQKSALPWERAEVAEQLDRGKRALSIATPRLAPTRPKVMRRAAGAMAMFEAGIRVLPGSEENFAVCFDRYLSAANLAFEEFYDGRRNSASTLPDSQAIARSVAGDPLLDHLRQAIG